MKRYYHALLYAQCTLKGSLMKPLKLITLSASIICSTVFAFAEEPPAQPNNDVKVLEQLYNEIKATTDQYGAVLEDVIISIDNPQNLQELIAIIPKPNAQILDIKKKLQSESPQLTVAEVLVLVEQLLQSMDTTKSNKAWQTSESLPAPYKYAVKLLDDLKKPRPSAVSPTANNAIVGKSDGCDLTPVIALLNTIKKQLIELREIICQKFMETWTILEDIKSDIFDTQTILCGKFSETWTILADIDFDIFDTRTIICEKFNETWTILADIEQDIFDTQTILCGKFFETWTILDALSACDPTPIFEPTTITEPGTYCLANDIAGQITIAASRVYLDMNGKQISGGTNGIEVTAGMSDIYVFNGTIGATTERGFLVNPGGTNINITAVDFINSPTGLAVLGTGGANNQFLTIQNTSFRDQTSIAATFENCHDLRIHEMACIVSSMSEEVLEFIGSNQNVSCSKIDIGPVAHSGNVRVIIIDGIANGTFDSCIIHNNDAGGSFDGIMIENSNDLVFSNCSITNCSSITSSPFQGITLIAPIPPIGEPPTVRNIIFNNCRINANLLGASANHYGIQATLCRDITCNGCEVKSNQADFPGTALSFIGISTIQCVKVICSECQCNDNLQTNYTIGYLANNATDHLFKNSTALENIGTATAIGFFSLGGGGEQISLKVIFDSCVANDNIGSSDLGTGFRLESTQQSCLLNSIAKANAGTISGAEGVGIDLIDTVSCTVRDNIVVNNRGAPTPTNSFGIRATTAAATQTTVIWSNQSQGHFDAATGGGASGLENNYVSTAAGIDASIPASIFDVTSGIFTPMPPSVYDNISVE